MPFPSQVNQYQAPAVAGDFASANPRASVVAGEGGLKAGPNGVTIGLFAWIDPTSGTLVNNTGAGAPTGFVHREQQALITTFLGETSYLVPAGMEVTLHQAGDFWVKNTGTLAAIPGMKAYANNATGAVTFGATGSAPTGASVTGSIAAATSVSVTGSIAGSVLTVTAVSTGSIAVGTIISGTGVQTGTMVTAILTGTGGVGTYSVSIPQTVASTTISGSYGVLTVTAVSSGALAVGDLISGSGVTSGTYITGLGTGTGGTGTYNVSPSQTASSTTITVAAATETKWYAASYAAAGELVKMSSWAVG